MIMKGPFQLTIFQVIKITIPKVISHLSLFLYLLQEDSNETGEP
jgi:hypothetical protein